MQITDLVYIDATGYHYSDYPSFLSWLKDSYRAIYGADVYLEADSQDGQFLAILAKAFYDTATLGASTYNSFSPSTAQGLGLSRVVKINGLARLLPSKSTVDLTVIGQSGTTITNGVATDSLQQKWVLPTTTIPGGGSITVTAEAENEGAIEAAANTVNIIFTPTRGWQSVNNVAAATAGAPVESDSLLRARQSVSTANPSLTVLEGTTGAVANLDGVQKVKSYENDTNATDSNSIPAHSISVVVVGGDDTEIAQAIADHKTPGTGTYGNTSETVYDSHGMPIDIAFNRAVTATIQATVTLAAGVGWSSDFEALIQQAVADKINSGAIGAKVVQSQLYAPAYLFGTAPGQTYIISTLEIGKNGGGQSSSNITLTYRENPLCDPDTDVVIVVT